jgi:hypothetical protein
MAVHGRPLKIKIAILTGIFVRGRPPLFAGIAVKLLSKERLGLTDSRPTHAG